MMVRNNLKALIKEKGMTQKQLADKVGLTEACISRYVNNSRTGNYMRMAIIARALDVPMEALFTEDVYNNG